MPIRDPLFILFVILLTVAVYFLKKKSREKRVKGVQDVADELNFTFTPGADEMDLLYYTGHPKKRYL